MNLLILGAGGHGRVVYETAKTLGRYNKIDFLDDQAKGAIGVMADYLKYRGFFEHAFVALGNCHMRRKWYERLKDAGYEIPVIIHPDAYVSESCWIGGGTIIMPKAVVQSNVKICMGGIISSGAIIDHDAIINEFCHVNSGAIVPAMSVVPGEIKIDYGEIYRC